MDRNGNTRYSVVGYGSWATTIVGQLTSKGKKVSWHITNPDVIEGIINDGHNPKYVKDLSLDVNMLDISSDINEVISNGDIIILATPSAYLEKALEGLDTPLQEKFFISAIKGIIPDSCETVLSFMQNRFGVSPMNLGLISGPTHAEEVSMGRLSFLTAACPTEEQAAFIADELGSGNFRIETSTDVLGIEYAGIMKNIYAIAAGLASGLGYGDNFLAVLIAASAREMRDFLDSNFPLEGRDSGRCSYLGDLLVTCYSNYSRNRRLGSLIGRGCEVKSARNEMIMIAEGYFAADCLHRINQKNGSISLPIAEAVYQILYTGARARKKIEELAKTVL